MVTHVGKNLNLESHFTFSLIIAPSNHEE